MKQFTVYYDTLDYPGVYCVREWKISKGQVQAGKLLGTTKSLGLARNLIPAGYHPFHRSEKDDPKIVEIWL